MKFTITKLYYNILSILLIHIIISCNAKDCEKLHMQSEVLDKKDNDQIETLLIEKMNNKISNFKNTKEYIKNVACTSNFTELDNTYYSKCLDYSELEECYLEEKNIITSQYSKKNYLGSEFSNVYLKKINKEKFAQISKNIIENYLKDEPIYQVVRNNEKLVNPVNTLEALLIKTFTKLPEFYTELFKKCPSSILNLISNYYITYNIEEELVKLTELLQNINLYEYYENFNKNLFYTLNNIKVQNAIKFHIKYLKKIKEYIENVEFYKPMYKNELTNIENFCNWFKNINTNIISKEYKNDLKFTEKQKLLLRDFSIIKSTEKDIQKKCTFPSINIKGESQIKSWVYDLLIFNQLIGLSSVTIGADLLMIKDDFFNKFYISEDLRYQFIIYIQVLSKYNFKSFRIYLSQIYHVIEPIFDVFIETKIAKCFKYYVLKEAINKITACKKSISNISEFKELKNFIKEKLNFDNVLLNKFIEQKAVDILLSNNITKTQIEKHEFIKSLLEWYVHPERQVSVYNQNMINYIESKYESF